MVILIYQNSFYSILYYTDEEYSIISNKKENYEQWINFFSNFYFENPYRKENNNRMKDLEKMINYIHTINEDSLKAKIRKFKY